MARRRRTIEIISLSAIDLFASTLGAFVIITAILIPYYPNMKDGGEIAARLRAEIEADRQETAASENKIRALLAERKRKEDINTLARRAEAARSALQQKTRSLKTSNDEIAAQVAALRAELRALVSSVEAKKKAQGSQGLTDFSILGITTRAKKILIVVDLSGSMDAWSQTLVETLVEIIEPFHKDIHFGIIGFQGFGISQYWPVEGRMAIGDESSKISARSFIGRIPGLLNGGTPTKAALLRALQYRPESIILVSDGAPDDDEPEDIIRTVTRLNQGRVEINTVAVGRYLIHSRLIEFLNKLAKENRGQFVGVIND